MTTPRNQHLNLKLRAPYRLHALRVAADAMNAQPHRREADKVSWRNMRYVNFATASPAWSAGFDSGSGKAKTPIWCAQADDVAPGMRWQWCDAVGGVGRSIEHRGWYQDPDGCAGTIRGFVVYLPHGRLLAGYRDNEHGNSFLYGEQFTDPRSAAHAADHVAQLAAETEREYQCKWQKGNALHERLGEIKERLAELQVLIDSGKFPNASTEAARLTDEGARITETLNTEYAEYEFS